jgi:hypothetical protein
MSQDFGVLVLLNPDKVSYKQAKRAPFLAAYLVFRFSVLTIGSRSLPNLRTTSAASSVPIGEGSKTSRLAALRLPGRHDVDFVAGADEVHRHRVFLRLDLLWLEVGEGRPQWPPRT